MGKGQFFLHCHKKCQFCFTQEIKDNLNFAPKVVSNYQNQSVEAEKLFKKVTFSPDSTVCHLATHSLFAHSSMTKHNQKQLEIENKIVHEVARGDKHYLKNSADRKAQIS